MKTMTMDKPSKEIFGGIDKATKNVLIGAFKLSQNLSDNDVFDVWDNFCEKYLKPAQEHLELSTKIAELTIDSFVREGMLESELRDGFVKLAVHDHDTTIEVIKNRYSQKLEVQELTKLSGHDLYMSGKLERLKELNQDHFQLKFDEISKGDYNQEISNEDLFKLSGHDLYMSGKLETLKELNFDIFKTKYKECFGKEYKD